MTGAAPSGVVTFLFTDIEGSTRRWENDADAMRAALAAHDVVGSITGIVALEITTAIAHLRDVLGEKTYESLAEMGETMMAYVYTKSTKPEQDSTPSRNRRDTRVSEVCIG